LRPTATSTGLGLLAGVLGLLAGIYRSGAVHCKLATKLRRIRRSFAIKIAGDTNKEKA
jgi:hypothetical protein